MNPEQLERHIQRLGEHIAALRARERRFVWYRLAALLGGGLATWLAARAWGGAWGWVALGLGVAVFGSVVACNRRLEAGIERFKIFTRLKSDQLARLRLDWEHIPLSPSAQNQEPESLAFDLDLTGSRSLLHLLDITVSQEGSQRLAAWLTRDHPDLAQIEARQQVVRELALMKRFRERLLLAFHQVSSQRMRGDRLTRWLQVEADPARIRWSLPAAILLTAANLALLLLNLLGNWPPYWILSGALYLGLYYYNFTLLEEFLEALVQLDAELGVFRKILALLENFDFQRTPHLGELCRPFQDPHNLPSRLLSRVKLATAGVGVRMNPVLSLFINAITPWDFAFAALALRYRRQMAAVLPGWLEAWYRLEALISLANFAHLNPDYAFPEIVPGTAPVFQAKRLGHPLLSPDEKVVNDFNVEGLGQVEVITGSNMAGKSTFIKTVGINLCLAYAGGPVNAARLRSAPFRLHTCIRISDSIPDGFSYFYAEVRCLKRLMEKLDSGAEYPLLYLIDEIFRGTNNRERLIGSQAYVQSLVGKAGVGLIATHDLELAGLGQRLPQVYNFHFRDEVQDGKLVFDFKIRPGPSPTTNALKIMAMEGLPVEPQEVEDSHQ